MTPRWVLIVALALFCGSTASAAPDSAIAQGEAVFQRHCAACHGAGIGRPGTEVLQQKYKGALPALLAERRDLSPDLVRTVARHGIGWMPGFRKTEISDADLDLLAAYLSRNSRTN